tara:strand:+ start:841 stop:1548 length:708 start_codon:yes stop_codon:yes gene_type:complete
MNEAIKERISALVDGELSEFEARRVLDEVESNPELRDYWVRLQLLKSGLTDESLGFLNSDISTRVSRELGRKPRELQKHSLKKTSSRFFISVASSFSLVFIISLGFLVNIDNVITPDEIFAMETSEQIKEAIYSPEALEVLDNAFSGMSVSLEKLGSGNNGQLYANYKIPADGKKFRVSLVPISLYSDIAYSGASKLSYIETNRGTYIVSVSGDISPERKSKILRNVNFSLKKQP